MRRVGSLWQFAVPLLAAALVLYLLAKPSAEPTDVQDPSQIRIVSPGGKWIAVFRRSVLSVNPQPDLPVDQLFIEPHGTRKVIVEPVFVAKWKHQQQYKI